MSFSGARVLSLEARRAAEMAQLIRISGGEPFLAPALVEVPLEQNEAAFAFAERLRTGQVEMAIFLTGVGTRYLDRVLATRQPEEEWRAELRRITVVARGPKPMAVLREWQVPTVSVPEPNTWREVLAVVAPYPEKRVSVQEYGRPSTDLMAGLQAQGREVNAVPVYQWAFPQDREPLRQALEGIIRGDFPVVLFTTSVQVEHLVQLATEAGQREVLLEGLRRTFIASIGPTCSEAIQELGLTPQLEPSHPKMGRLVQETAQAWLNSRTSGTLPRG